MPWSRGGSAESFGAWERRSEPIAALPAGLVEPERGSFSTMKSATKTSIDGSGHLVIPKRVREAAGLEPGVALEVRYRDGRVEIEPAPLEIEVVQALDGLPVAATHRPVPTLEADTVREVLDRVRDPRKRGS